MKKLTLVTITTILLILPALQAGRGDSKLNATLSLLYLDGSGSPDENYLGSAEKKYESLVPRLSFTWDISEHLQASVSYTDFGALEADWIAPQAPPFEGIGLDVITPFKIEEEMDSLGAGLAYASGLGGGSLKIGLGAERISNEHKGWISKKEEDWALAISIGYEYPISDSFSISAEYLQIEPPRKTLHLVGGSFNWKF